MRENKKPASPWELEEQAFPERQRALVRVVLFGDPATLSG